MAIHVFGKPFHIVIINVAAYHNVDHDNRQTERYALMSGKQAHALLVATALMTLENKYVLCFSFTCKSKEVSTSTIKIIQNLGSNELMFEVFTLKALLFGLKTWCSKSVIDPKIVDNVDNTDNFLIDCCNVGDVSLNNKL